MKQNVLTALVIFSFSLTLLITSCGERKSSGPSDPSAGAEEEPLDLPDNDVELLNAFTQNGDSVTIPEFEIEIVLTDNAEAVMEKAGETIIVQAYITGTPKEDAQIELTEMGEVYLAGPNVELTDSRVASFRNVNLSRKSFESLADQDFQVLINVFSGRRSSDVNLLDCDILQEPISFVGGRRHSLAGKLIDD